MSWEECHTPVIVAPCSEVPHAASPIAEGSIRGLVVDRDGIGHARPCIGFDRYGDGRPSGEVMKGCCGEHAANNAQAKAMKAACGFGIFMGRLFFGFHLEAHLRTFQKCGIAKERPFRYFSVDSHFTDITVLGAVLRSVDLDRIAVFEVNDGLGGTAAIRLRIRPRRGTRDRTLRPKIRTTPRFVRCPRRRSNRRAWPSRGDP